MLTEDERWAAIGVVLQIFLQEGRFDLAREFIDILENKKIKI